MPALPWKRIDEVDADDRADGDGVTTAAAVSSAHSGVPPATLRIRRQLAEAPGVVGYALDAKLFAKTFWTVSAWRSREQLEAFAATDPHRGDVGKIRSHMEPTTFVFWTATASDLPIPWDDVRRRIEV